MEELNNQTGRFHDPFPAIARQLASRWMTPIVVAIALVLTIPTIFNGLAFDDYYHRAVLNGSARFSEQLRGPQAMFRFLPGDPEHARACMDTGLLPWWTNPNIKAEFFQLVPTQTHILDYWLWPDWPELMHVHSLLWFALLVCLAAHFYRRILGPTWMAGVAALLFAVEDAHALPVGWICNRNILIAASFGIGCLIAHNAWRREGRRWALGCALLLWILSLCSKEAGIATSAYLFAWALWLDESTLWRRFWTLVPYGIVLVVWRIVRDTLGYGVANLGFYVDPIDHPDDFAVALFERCPVLLFGQWVGLSELSVIIDRLAGSPFWWLTVGCVSAVGLLCWPVLTRDRIARFFATGMLLAVIPVSATFPMDRLLMFVGLGAFGLLVRFLNAIFFSDVQVSRRPVWRLVSVPVALLLMLLHLALAPILLAVRAIAPFGPREVVDGLYLDVPFDESIEEQDLIVVNYPPMSLGLFHSLLNYEHNGMPVPKALRTLAPGMDSVTVRRTDTRTIEVESRFGYLALLDRLFRSEQHPLQLGETVAIARMTATVVSVREDGRPQTVAFRFDAPLEDSSLRWLCFQTGEYIPWHPPPVGEEVKLTMEWKLRFW